MLNQRRSSNGGVCVFTIKYEVSGARAMMLSVKRNGNLQWGGGGEGGREDEGREKGKTRKRVIQRELASVLGMVDVNAWAIWCKRGNRGNEY
jgi:hypothetical protein